VRNGLAARPGPIRDARERRFVALAPHSPTVLGAARCGPHLAGGAWWRPLASPQNSAEFPL